MEYIYAALLLHKLDKEVNEENLKKVIQAAGSEPDEVKTKALVAALSEVDIEEALKSTVVAPTPAAAPAEAAPKEEKKKEEEKEEEEEKKEEEALAGLSSLFG